MFSLHTTKRYDQKETMFLLQPKRDFMWNVHQARSDTTWHRKCQAITCVFDCSDLLFCLWPCIDPTKVVQLIVLQVTGYIFCGLQE